MADDQKEEVTDLTTLGNIQGTMERPKSLDKNDLAGAEDIDANEIRLPRLTMAQGLSPQITPGDAQYIEGLTLFDMFNDMSSEIYGKGPITFVPVSREIRRIEFIPRTEGGGVADLNVPKGDPRLQWTKSTPDAQRADVPPAATEFYEYIVLLLRPGKAPEPIVFSIAKKNKWNKRAIDKLDTVIKLRPPIYANLYSVDTKTPGKNDKGTFAVPTIRDLGYIPKDTPAGAALFKFAKEFHDSLEGKTVTTAPPQNEDTDFDPAALEREPAPAGSTDM